MLLTFLVRYRYRTTFTIYYEIDQTITLRAIQLKSNFGQANGNVPEA